MEVVYEDAAAHSKRRCWGAAVALWCRCTTVAVHVGRMLKGSAHDACGWWLVVGDASRSLKGKSMV